MKWKDQIPINKATLTNCQLTNNANVEQIPETINASINAVFNIMLMILYRLKISKPFIALHFISELVTAEHCNSSIG